MKHVSAELRVLDVPFLAGKWGSDTFRKWVPPKVTKRDVETQDAAKEVKLSLPTPALLLKDTLKTTALEGPKSIF